MLLAVPPGQALIRITPAARPGSRPKDLLAMYPSEGMMVYWRAAPRPT